MTMDVARNVRLNVKLVQVHRSCCFEATTIDPLLSNQFVAERGPNYLIYFIFSN